MSEQEINDAIAEACGRERNPDGGWYPDNGLRVGTQAIPDYCTDLNAMHEALVLLNTWRLRDNYFGWLREILDAEFDNWKVYAASPRHCAEALLRTLGKWEEVQP